MPCRFAIPRGIFSTSHGAICTATQAEQEWSHGRAGLTAKSGGARGEDDGGYSSNNGNASFGSAFDCAVGRGGCVPLASPPAQVSHVASVRCAPSHDSSLALDTESQRLDKMMSILGANSCSTSSSNGAQEVATGLKKTYSDKNNVDETAAPRLRVNCLEPAPDGHHSIVSPASSLGMGSPTTAMRSAPSEAGCHEHTRHFFQEDTSKNNAAALVNNSPADRERRPQEQVDEALDHARRAGPLWRALVGSHVRFPSRWEDLLDPPAADFAHCPDRVWSRWFYVARHRVKGDRRLNGREYGVRSRRSAGRLLLRLVVREAGSAWLAREVAIGCFHPNARGVRRGDPLPEAEDVREVWMAVRWSVEKGGGVGDSERPRPDPRTEGDSDSAVVEGFLMQKRGTLDYGTMGSALGHRKAVNNENVRAVSTLARVCAMCLFLGD